MLKFIYKSLCSILILVFSLATGAWQSVTTVFAAEGVPETLLYPGVTWDNSGQTVRKLQLNIQGDYLEISGDTFQAAEKFSDLLPQELKDFYSNVGLFKYGWVSDNAFEDSEGIHRIFYHDSGYYLAIEYLKCGEAGTSTCVTVWKSLQKDLGTVVTAPPSTPVDLGTSALFVKKTPADSSTGLNPSSVFLSWSIYSGSFEKYSYCYKAGLACVEGDPNWTGTYKNTSITISDLSFAKTYYWHVKAIIDANAKPKTFVLANNGTSWKFSTTSSFVKITGNTKVAGVTLKYVDGINKTVSSDSTGAYSITVPYNWTGKITPVKTGITSFTPVYRNYSNLKVYVTSQNFRPNYLKTFNSLGIEDGFILESSENSGVGGTLNSTVPYFVLGDNAQNKQYRSILSFSTTAIPDTAVIYAAKLKIIKNTLVGTNPNTTHGSIVINIKKPKFGTVSTLELADFNDTAGLEAAGTVGKTPVGAVYTGTLNSSSFSQINKTGTTQLRLYFLTDDSNDNSADYLTFFSGNNSSSKPVLQVYYYMP